MAKKSRDYKPTKDIIYIIKDEDTMRLTVEEYSKHFKMSKEMINSKLRAKKLNYIIENGTTYIIVTRSSLQNEQRQEIHQAKKEQTKQVVKPKATVSMVISLYQKENQQLKEKITQLEEKIDKLIDDKEQMLREEMNRIEQVYSAKDEQLKNILELINKQITMQQTSTIHEVETLDKQTLESKAQVQQVIELKEYLKTLDLTNHEKKAIKKNFLSTYDKDVRIIKQNGKILLDFSKYDYSDLLNN